MKKISKLSILSVFIIFSISILFCLAITYLILYRLLHIPFEYDFTYFIFFSFFLFFLMIINLRTWIHFFPTPIGIVPESELWHVHAYQIFYLVFFNPIVISRISPTPLLRTFYQAIGAKMGENSYSGGTIYDAHLVTVGSNCILGDTTLLTPHQIEGTILGYYPIVLGNNVTIGAHAVILGGVTIEDGGIVAAGAVVSKNTYIKKGEIWGGIPARLIKANTEI